MSSALATGRAITVGGVIAGRDGLRAGGSVAAPWLGGRVRGFGMPSLSSMSSTCVSRAARVRELSSPMLISISGADPLNLVGILTPGPKLAALTGNRLLYRDGLPVALLVGSEVQYIETLDPAGQWEARKALLRAVQPAPVDTP